MSYLRFCFMLAVISSCSNLGFAELTTPKTILIPVEKLQPSSSSTVIPVTTLPSETTTPVETTTTSKITTTSTTTTSTTTPSTTTPNTTPTTTSSTTTSTPAPTPAPSPAPTPGPLPPPDQGTWSYTNKTTNVTCIVVQFAAQLNVTYTKVVDNVTSLATILLNVPVNATVVDGSCMNDQWLQLSWPTMNATNLNNMTIVYHLNETNKSYGVKSINITLAFENFVNGSSQEATELYHGAEWATPLATSYRCKQPTQLNMTSESVSAATVTLSRLQEEAYRSVHGDGFSAARECGGGDVPDAVPIAVGCALGGLVVVVLIAYLVGRRRSAARGYLSM